MLRDKRLTTARPRAKLASELQHHQVRRVLQNLLEQLAEQRLAKYAVPAPVPAAEAIPCRMDVQSGVEREPRQQVPGDGPDL